MLPLLLGESRTVGTVTSRERFRFADAAPSEAVAAMAEWATASDRGSREGTCCGLGRASNSDGKHRWVLPIEHP